DQGKLRAEPFNGAADLLDRRPVADRARPFTDGISQDEEEVLVPREEIAGILVRAAARDERAPRRAVRARRVYARADLREERAHATQIPFTVRIPQPQVEEVGDKLSRDLLIDALDEPVECRRGREGLDQRQARLDLFGDVAKLVHL